jgi:hypothetical protein
MKLSLRMRECLAAVVATQTMDGWPTRIRSLPRWTHAANRITHEALVRRGLLTVSRRYGVMATRAGLAEARAQAAKGFGAA